MGLRAGVWGSGVNSAVVFLMMKEVGVSPCVLGV